MKPSPITLPGYAINEYQLVISPHQELRDKIKTVREVFCSKYGIAAPIRGNAHVTLVHFKQYAMMEERILGRLSRVAMGFPAFKVECRDFGSYPSHSLFIRVATREPVRELVKEIKPFQALLRLNTDHKPHFMEEPHIPLATRLLPWQYEKGWLEYSRQHFSGRFMADGMLLLRRRALSEEPYQILKRMAFMNLPVSIRQGELFG